MYNKILFLLILFSLPLKVSSVEKVIVFDFTEEEFISLKVRKVKGETTWRLGSNENGNFIRAEAVYHSYCRICIFLIKLIRYSSFA